MRVFFGGGCCATVGRHQYLWRMTLRRVRVLKTLSCNKVFLLMSESKAVNVKVLYTFDDRTSFLARSQTPTTARVLTLPTQQQVGCVDVRACVALVQNASPEWFTKGADYALYYKDILEANEPYVGFGLCSKILRDKKGAPQLVTGTVSTNFMSLLSNTGVSDTLEVKLRFSALPMAVQRKKTAPQAPSSPVSSDPIPKGSSSPLEEFSEPPARRRAKKQPLSAPIMASRTQSLPFFDENSLAHKIRLADKAGAAPTVDRDVHSRFQIGAPPPAKAKKTKSFVQAIVKIGDTTVNEAHHKCINCSLANSGPYKYHKEGIFHFGNAGYLCNTCTKFKTANDAKSLRERGEMGANGLLQGPYSKSTKRRRRDHSSPIVGSSPVTYKKAKQSSHKLINNFPLMHSSKENTPADLFDITNMLNDGADGADGAQSADGADSADGNAPHTDHDFFKKMPEYDPALLATKLNTTLIQLDDEESKENRPRQGSASSAHGAAPKHIFSPSIQRIIESFTETANAEQPPSPTAQQNQGWTYDFFNNNAGVEDDEINRILNPTIAKRTPHQVDSTPKDADTVQTSNDDSPASLQPPSSMAGSALPGTLGTATSGAGANNVQRPKVNMPSSPFFSIPEQNEDDSRTSIPWERSSPSTELSLETK